MSPSRVDRTRCTHPPLLRTHIRALNVTIGVFPFAFDRRGDDDSLGKSTACTTNNHVGSSTNRVLVRPTVIPLSKPQTIFF